MSDPSGACAQRAAQRRLLERFLVDKDAPPPLLAVLRGARLAGHAYTELPDSHRYRTELHHAYRAATMRHIAVRARFAPLVRAWRNRGIEVLVFKGFHLAEFVYDAPGQREYSDVDVLIEPGRADDVASIAQSLGWRESWRADRPTSMFATDSQNRPERYLGHEVINLDAPDLDLRLDVHRRIVHNEIGALGVQERITHEAWRAAHRVPWEGTTIWTPSPEDAVLLGIVLNRAWGRDEWHIKPSDWVDVSTIVRASGMKASDLAGRAEQLGCARTFEVFRRRLDVFEGVLDLEPPTFGQRMRWGFEIVPERGHPGLELVLVRWRDTPSRALDMIAALPSVIDALRHVRSAGPYEAPHHPTPTREDSEPLTYRAWKRLQRAVKRNLMLLGRYGGPEDPLFLLALWFGLRRRGVHVQYRVGGEPQTHARSTRVWIELAGEALPVEDMVPAPMTDATIHDPST